MRFGRPAKLKSKFDLAKDGAGRLGGIVGCADGPSHHEVIGSGADSRFRGDDAGLVGGNAACGADARGDESE